jgi:hypothetical protein
MDTSNLEAARKKNAAMTIFWSETGPLLHYDGNRLLISDLNPSQEMRWSLSRWEMVKIGLRCIRAAFMA